MPTTREAKAARRALDGRFQHLTAVEQLTPPPRGWVRALREALGMSLADLGSRMNVAAPTIAALESSERLGSVQLNTLRRAALAMNCDLVYALVPRRSLEETVRSQAFAKVQREVFAVERSMDLEAQTAKVSPDVIEEEVRALIASARLWK